MDIIAETLSVQQFNVNTKLTVNGLDVFDYIQSKLSTAVEFIGGYSDINLAPKKNGYIAIVGTKEYIYSNSQSDWIQIGDETLYGQIVDYLNKAPEYVVKTELSDYAKEDSLTVYVETDILSNYALTSDLTSYAKKTDFDILSSYVKSNVLTSYAQLSDLNQDQLSTALGLNYKSYESTSANALTSNFGAYYGFQLKLSAFSNAKIYSFDFYRPSGTYGTATGTKLSVIGSSASTFAGVNADNTYIMSDGTVTYPNENTPYTVKMKYADKVIPLDLSTMFFYFVDSATNTNVNVRFNVYGNYTTGTVATFLHGQAGWFVQLTANTITTSLVGYVTPSQMESYVVSQISSLEEVDPKFAALSSQFLTQQSLAGYATTSSLTALAEKQQVENQFSAITANIDALSGLVVVANNSLETILNESL